MPTDADKSADDLWSAGWTAEEAGRRDEARSLWVRSAEQGSLSAMLSLGHVLTESGPEGRAEGIGWYERAAGLGDEQGAWCLAMEHRLQNDPAAYLKWMERAAALGSVEAEQITRVISTRIAAGREWPMYIWTWVDLDEVWRRLQAFQDGDIDGPGLVSWAREIVEGRTALGVGGVHARATRDALRDLADGDGDILTARRVKELLFKFEAIAGEA